MGRSDKKLPDKGQIADQGEENLDVATLMGFLRSNSSSSTRRGIPAALVLRNPSTGDRADVAPSVGNLRLGGGALAGPGWFLAFPPSAAVSGYCIVSSH